MLFHLIILSCFEKFRNGRRISAVYHLLTGKRSIQTAQDAHIYQLDRFYGIYPTLSKETFNKHIQQMASGKLLFLNNDHTALPATNSNHLLHQVTDSARRYIKERHYHRQTTMFWERLLLMIQTMTNSRMSHFQFIPIIDKREVTDWVKKQYRQWKTCHSTFLQRLYQELYQLLQWLPEKEAGIVVDSLTGFNHYGMSSFQLAGRYQLEQIDIPLIRTAILHRMMTIIKQDSKTYPFLSRLIYELPQKMPLTNSASKTKAFIDRQYDLHDIAVIRDLKLNTIYDHIVEIALYDETFPLERYVSYQKQEVIHQAVQQAASYKLKAIKQQVDETISYFHIRLVLAAQNIAQQGDDNGNGKSKNAIKATISNDRVPERSKSDY